MTSLTVSIALCAASVVFSFFYGLSTRNYSTVDRLWSVLPPVYMLIWLPDFAGNPRYIVVLGLVFLWGTRLTANFAVKGGYSFKTGTGFTGEDYRWEILRERIPNRPLFELFNLFFISTFQLALIFMFTLPAYYYGQTTGPVKVSEIILFAVHLLLLGCELYSDILQLRYYSRRNSAPWNTRRRYSLGFNTFGPWKFSRHPNYVCEMGQWVVIYFLLYAASGSHHYTAIGAAVLIILFAGSTVFAESVTLSKYPAYREWKKITSVWIPVKSFFTAESRKEFLAGRVETSAEQA